MNSYYEHSSISQSQLKCLLIHPKAFTNERESELYFEEKKHFTVGSAVDYCLTQSEREFSEEYHISNLQNKPSDTVKSIINMMFDILISVKEIPIEDIRLINDIDYYEVVLESCDVHNYQPTYREQTRVNKIYEHYEYWEDLKSAFGKTVLSQEESILIDSIVMSIRTNEACSKYFNSPDVRYQLPIYFEFNDVDCKALLDMVVFDHPNKVIQPIDIKTLGDYTLNFSKSVRRRRYDIQAAYYTEALKWLYPEYTILPFKFIVESTTAPGQPLVFTCDETLLDIGKNGMLPVYQIGDMFDEDKVKSNVYFSRTQEIKGFVQLLELYKYYSTNGFELDQVTRENNSELTIDWSGIIV